MRWNGLAPVLLLLVVGCSTAEVDREKELLRGRVSELQKERNDLFLRVAELEKELREARELREAAPPAPRETRLSSDQRSTLVKLVKTESALKRAEAKMTLLEEKMSVQDALLTESPVKIDKAVRAQIDAMYRRSLSAERAAWVAQNTIRHLKNVVVEMEERSERANRLIAQLRAELAKGKSDRE